jgi:hypothetical protein
LGSDLGIEIATADSCSRLGRGTKPNNRCADLDPTYNRSISSAINEQASFLQIDSFILLKGKSEAIP